MEKMGKVDTHFLIRLCRNVKAKHSVFSLNKRSLRVNIEIIEIHKFFLFL